MTNSFTSSAIVLAAIFTLFINVTPAAAQYGGGGGGGSAGSFGTLFNNPALSNSGASAYVAPTQTGAVLGASTVKCPAYMTKFNRFGTTSSEIAKLRSFINKYEGGTLATTGSFTAADAAAVKVFQKKYGIIPVSGHQLTKTTKKINELYCTYAGI
jgi:hypothetical protein